MIVGIGTDIVHISRIKSSTDRLGERFAERVLTPDELVQWRDSNRPDNYLAKRFAIKEAASKALGTGIGRGVSWQHFHISHTDWGAPLLSFSDGAAERAEQLGVNQIHLTLSDEQDTVVAFVVLEH